MGLIIPLAFFFVSILKKEIFIEKEMKKLYLTSLFGTIKCKSKKGYENGQYIKSVTYFGKNHQ